MKTLKEDNKDIPVYRGPQGYVEANLGLFSTPSAGKFKKFNKDGFDSDEEKYFSWYLDELIEAGIIRGYVYQPLAVSLTEKKNMLTPVLKKTKKALTCDTKEYLFIREHVFTPDFLVLWSKDAILEKFVTPVFNGDDNVTIMNRDVAFMVNICDNEQEMFSVIDVKGEFARKGNNSAVTFPLNQKWVFDKYGIYVQKIVPNGRKDNCLFSQTFTPKKYLFTDKSGKGRTIKFKVKTLEEYGITIGCLQ
jgi:hypothetical protein